MLCQTRCFHDKNKTKIHSIYISGFQYLGSWVYKRQESRRMLQKFKYQHNTKHLKQTIFSFDYIASSTFCTISEGMKRFELCPDVHATVL